MKIKSLIKITTHIKLKKKEKKKKKKKKSVTVIYKT